MNVNEVNERVSHWSFALLLHLGQQLSQAVAVHLHFSAKDTSCLHVECSLFPLQALISSWHKPVFSRKLFQSTPLVFFFFFLGSFLYPACLKFKALRISK